MQFTVYIEVNEDECAGHCPFLNDDECTLFNTELEDCEPEDGYCWQDEANIPKERCLSCKVAF